jgi:transposase-like protein
MRRGLVLTGGIQIERLVIGCLCPNRQKKAEEMPDKYNQIGVHCPNCHDTRSSVTMTRSHNGKTFRRRKCKGCNQQFTTVEQYVSGNMKAAVGEST